MGKYLPNSFWYFFTAIGIYSVIRELTQYIHLLVLVWWLIPLIAIAAYVLKIYLQEDENHYYKNIVTVLSISFSVLVLFNFTHVTENISSWFTKGVSMTQLEDYDEYGRLGVLPSIYTETPRDSHIVMVVEIISLLCLIIFPLTTNLFSTLTSDYSKRQKIIRDKKRLEWLKQFTIKEDENS